MKQQIDGAKRQMEGAVKNLSTEFGAVRTGRASTHLLDRIQVEAYGAKTPLNQLATLHAPEPRLLTVQPFDKTLVKSIEKALQESDLGLTPSNDGQVIRAAALKHHGILIQPMYIVHEDVVAGRLVPVLQEWELARLVINVAYPTRRHLPAKVRCFVDFLVEVFQRNDYERRWTA